MILIGKHFKTPRLACLSVDDDSAKNANVSTKTGLCKQIASDTHLLEWHHNQPNFAFCHRADRTSSLSNDYTHPFCQSWMKADSREFHYFLSPASIWRHAKMKIFVIVTQFSDESKKCEHVSKITRAKNSHFYYTRRQKFLSRRNLTFPNRQIEWWNKIFFCRRFSRNPTPHAD